MNNELSYRRCSAFLHGFRLWAASGAVLLICMLCGGFWMRSYAQPAGLEIEIPYFQVFTTDDTSVDDTFYYLLTPDEETPQAPMPENTENGVYRFAIRGNATGSLKITYPLAGIFRYKVTPVNEGKTGYTYDKGIYRISVYVAWDDALSAPGEGTIIVEEGIDKVPRIEFDPSYTGGKKTVGDIISEINESPPPVQGTLVSIKPKTGDSTPYIELLIACVSGYIVMWVTGRRRKKLLMSEDETHNRV